ncbi:hypothetical protein [Aquimarina spinulae]|uniref:hypothetical protein n=1 Tax=Aquimarina spinulae TaxID=1192023 RepID=UPI000D552EC7|nr:hypothetical protein [Aquimarina spinulae]
MKQLFKNNWDFVLYEVDGKKIISVVFYSSYVDVSKSFQLNSTEENFNFEQLKDLAEQIRNDYESYKIREIIPSI